MIQWQDIATCCKEPDKPVLLRVNGRPIVASWVAPDQRSLWPNGWWDNWFNGDPYGLPISGEPDAWAPIPE